MEKRVDTKKIRNPPEIHHPRYITGVRGVWGSFLEVRSFRKGITLVGFAQAVQNCSRTKFFHGAAMAAMGARGASMVGGGVQVSGGTCRPYPSCMLPSRLAQPSSKPPISPYGLRRLTISLCSGTERPRNGFEGFSGGPEAFLALLLATERSPLAPLSPIPMDSRWGRRRRRKGPWWAQHVCGQSVMWGLDNFKHLGSDTR